MISAGSVTGTAADNLSGVPAVDLMFIDVIGLGAMRSVQATRASGCEPETSTT